MLPLTLILLWLQLYWSLIPIWRDGEYYAYGWFVPPLAIALAWRRWNMWKEQPGNVGPVASGDRINVPTAIALVTVVAIVIPLRLIAEGDPYWRPPLLVHAALVLGITHALIWQCGCRGFSWNLVPVSILALSAVPPPWQIEQTLVRGLTKTVIALTSELFLLGGRPVEVSGERLILGADVVEVTDGCSGVRSLQSLLMAALFFGELLLLGWGRRLVLLFAAAGCAVVFNTGRAWLLADIRFTEGQAAADSAHDFVGHAAFVASAGSLLLAARFMQFRRDRKQVVIRRATASIP